MRSSLLKQALLIICFLLTSLKTHSFLWQDSGLDLYKNIDEWYEELELKNYKSELKWWKSSIKENINYKLKEKCIENEISPGEFKSIALHRDISTLYPKISNDCKWIAKLNKILDIITNIDILAKNTWNEKSEYIYKISKIWIFSDWVIENSDFDLIDDLKEIDKVIFTDDIEYNWEDISFSNDDALNDFINNWSIRKKSSDEINNNLSNDLNSDLGNQINFNEWDNSDFFQTNKLICNDENLQNSWLSQNTLDSILNLTSNDWLSLDWVTPDLETTEQNLEQWWYEKVNDNDAWWCSSFFCIVIEFVMYEHKFIWYDKITIEDLLNRSNKHLSKFANSSRIQASMWIGNFQLNLKFLNLPDIFHIWFMLTTKPIPILSELNNNKEDDDDDKKKWKFSKKDMLEDYYRAFNLEYERQNDLDRYNNKDPRIKSILDASNRAIDNVSNNNADLQEQLDKSKTFTDHISNAINKKIASDELNDFYDQLADLEKFAGALLEYTDSLKVIIKWMEKIPVKK